MTHYNYIIYAGEENTDKIMEAMNKVETAMKKADGSDCISFQPRDTGNERSRVRLSRSQLLGHILITVYADLFDILHSTSIFSF